MGKIKRVPCDVADCTRLVTHGICLVCTEQMQREEMLTIVNLHEAIKVKLGLPSYWACLDPDCHICGS